MDLLDILQELETKRDNTWLAYTVNLFVNPQKPYMQEKKKEKKKPLCETPILPWPCLMPNNTLRLPPNTPQFLPCNTSTSYVHFVCYKKWDA